MTRSHRRFACGVSSSQATNLAEVCSASSGWRSPSPSTLQPDIVPGTALALWWGCCAETTPHCVSIPWIAIAEFTSVASTAPSGSLHNELGEEGRGSAPPPPHLRHPPPVAPPSVPPFKHILCHALASTERPWPSPCCISPTAPSANEAAGPTPVACACARGNSCVSASLCKRGRVRIYSDVPQKCGRDRAGLLSMRLGGSGQGNMHHGIYLWRHCILITAFSLPGDLEGEAGGGG